jgi:hypothetical protein
MSGFAASLYNLIHARIRKGYKYNGYPVYNLSLSDAIKFESLAIKYGFPPQWLANLVNFESGGTFNPAIKNSIGATGLIQFLPSTLSGLGVTMAQLSAMNFATQLSYVDRYLSKFFNGTGVARGIYDKKKAKVTPRFSQTDLFMMVFYPDAVGKPGFMFPPEVSKANSGIRQPLDYAKRALNAATTPFRNALKDLREGSEKTARYTRRHWPAITLSIAGVCGLIFLGYKYRRQLGFVKHSIT